MAWLSQLTADTPYLTGIALPMVILGIGAGAAFTPLTAAGVAGVAPEDAGAASGLVNVAHQLGGSLGLGVLVTVFAAATPHLPARTLASATVRTDGLAHAISTSLTAGAGMLALALAVILVLIRRPAAAKVEPPETGRGDHQPGCQPSVRPAVRASAGHRPGRPASRPLPRSARPGGGTRRPART